MKLNFRKMYLKLNHFFLNTAYVTIE